ncbi:4'-phosphopantetheinyl transferase family protein [Undibacterium rugosum]|uniref:4'-phosphopantetheinyl transferase family protein n=1 Tax=Undibacterium rugosum TaxID=2762291 RepID=UPI001B8366DA|nr:4'-phosphopantetheinyl transferase superfamily protein [Undibacterium rugosum]MBR7778887.1 4'-phosphopantetheinyl transferase superfamily protein [Undibacterium rugosum]
MLKQRLSVWLNQIPAVMAWNKKPQQISIYLSQIATAEVAQHRNHLLSLLDQGETSRLHQYQHLGDQQRFLGGRALSKLLAAQLFQLPWSQIHQIRIITDQLGKPSIQLNQTNYPLSLSHNEHQVLVALSRQALSQDCKLGVDIEAHGIIPDLENLCATVCTAAESQDILSHPDPATRFIAYWSLKEALLKALGMGYRLDPLQFSLSLRQDRPCLISAPEGVPLNGWQFHLHTYTSDQHTQQLAIAFHSTHRSQLQIQQLPAAALLEHYLNETR